MIYNIRGSHGSGKSHSMHTLLAKYEHEDLMSGDFQVGVSVPELKLRLIGSYDIPSGGCDWFIRMVECPEGKTPSEVMGEWVEACHSDGWNVLLEGFMVSGTFGRWNDLAAKHAQAAGSEVWRFLCLDTPVEQCIKHVEERRARKGRVGVFDPVHLKKHYAQVANNRESFIKAGRVVWDIPWRDSPSVIEHCLKHDRMP